MFLALTTRSLRLVSVVAQVVAVAVVMVAASAEAVECRLRSQVHCTGEHVTLDDVAQIMGDRLVAAELGPTQLVAAPAAGTRLKLTVDQIQDLLREAGVDLTTHKFSGAPVVTIVGRRPSVNAAKLPEQLPLSRSHHVAAHNAVEAALTAHLKQATGSSQAWQFEFDLDDAQARAVCLGPAAVTAAGGSKPYLGEQRFAIFVDTPEDRLGFTCEVAVDLPPVVVKATRAIAKGSLVRADDLVLERLKPGQAVGNAFDSLDQVVGKEAVRAIAAGQTLDAQYVQAQLLVRRGETVTVFARTAGVQVRTTARSKDNAAMGELVTVESLSDRAVFQARVCGLQEVEIYARGNRVPTQATAEPTGAYQPQGGLSQHRDSELRPVSYEER